jgi:hypothetical protein
MPRAWDAYFMRNNFLIAGLALLIGNAFGQTVRSIEDIRSMEDAERLVHALDKKSEFSIKYDTSKWIWFSKQHDCDSIELSDWMKADFDGNGYSDLLVRGSEKTNYTTKIIFDNKRHRLRTRDFSNLFWSPCSELQADISYPGVWNYILYYKEREGKGKWAPFKSKVLSRPVVFKFGTFVEYNHDPGTRQIDSIIYKANGCFGTCPMFTIAFGKNKAAVYAAGKYNQKEGNFIGKIKTDNYNEIVELINYMDISELKNDYKTRASDGPSCELVIKFGNGDTKVIRDATMRGTFGLIRLYEMLHNLRTNQRWIEGTLSSVLKQ